MLSFQIHFNYVWFKLLEFYTSFTFRTTGNEWNKIYDSAGETDSKEN